MIYCQCGELLMMPTPASAYSVCAGGCGRLRDRLTDDARCINHARLAGVGLVEKYLRGWYFADETRPEQGVFYEHLGFGRRDLAAKPLKVPRGYTLGVTALATILVLVPEETFWHEVHLQIRRAPAGGRPPSDQPPPPELSDQQRREWLDRFWRKKSEY